MHFAFILSASLAVVLLATSGEVVARQMEDEKINLEEGLEERFSYIGDSNGEAANPRFKGGCQPLWYNRCKQNDECCSGFCDRPAHWEFGVCMAPGAGSASPTNGIAWSTVQNGEAANPRFKGGCQPLWYNRCKQNDECCSGFCDRPAHWEFGVCMAPGAGSASPTNGIAWRTVQNGEAANPRFKGGCQPLWYNRCKQNDECCSGFCDRPAHWEFGVCMAPGAGSASPTNGIAWSTVQNGEAANTRFKGGCQPLWYNRCKQNDECCSGFCDRPAHWEFGVCMAPGAGSASPTNGIAWSTVQNGEAANTRFKGGCQPLWYNRCKQNDECCSGFCDRPAHWEFGVCMAPGAGSASPTNGIPWNSVQNGDFTYYDDSGYGACGTYINAATENLVAISHEWFTSANPNIDQFCTQNVCIKVNYGGQSLTLPVKDKCEACTKVHIDLSKPAFQNFAPLSVGHVYGVTWSFVKCS